MSRVPGFVISLALVAGITFLYYSLVPVNKTTVALTFLLAILVVSTVWGFAVAFAMSLAGVLAFNYFFLPPVGTLTISDPQNWVALFAFLVTSVIGSELSSRARSEAEQANRSRRETEKLYEFSQRLLSSGNVIELLNAIPRQVVELLNSAPRRYSSQKNKRCTARACLSLSWKSKN